MIGLCQKILSDVTAANTTTIAINAYSITPIRLLCRFDDLLGLPIDTIPLWFEL